MTFVLTPELALRYLAELEPTIEAVAVLGADGTTLAGDPSLAARLAAGAAGLLTAHASTHTVIAAVGPRALAGLVRHDLEAIARDLG